MARQNLILQRAKEGNTLTAENVAARYGGSEGRAIKDLNALIANGSIVRKAVQSSGAGRLIVYKAVGL